MFGALLAGLPLATVDLWLDRIIERQINEDVVDNTRRAVVVLEARLAAVAAVLDDLASEGVWSCHGRDLEKLRRASFLTSPAKEFSVIGLDGQILCTDLGLSLGTREVLSVPRPIDERGVQVEVVRVGGSSAIFVRVRRFGPDGASLAALVPPDLLIPLTSNRGGLLGAFAQVFTRDGLLIGERGTPLPAALKPNEIVSATMNVDRFGMVATITRLKDASAAQDLRAVGLLFNLVALFAVFVLGWLIMHRRGGQGLDEIRRALDAGEFVPYFQPIVDIASGKILGAEVLAQARRQPGAPGRIPSVGGARRTDDRVDRIADAPRLRRGRRGLCAAAGAQAGIQPDGGAFRQRSHRRRSAHHLRPLAGAAQAGHARAHRARPDRGMTTTRRVIAALQGLGCQVALDDVGTGHSGLSSILRLGVDVIKIDKISIDSLGSERNSAAIVATLVELARNMGMEVVAEGVESFEQVEDLRARGIRAAQGYVFAPPLPASSFLTLLDALNPATAASGTQQGTRGGRVASTGLDLGGLRLADTKPAQAKESPGPDRDYSAASDDLRRVR